MGGPVRLLVAFTRFLRCVCVCVCVREREREREIERERERERESERERERERERTSARERASERARARENAVAMGKLVDKMLMLFPHVFRFAKEWYRLLNCVHSLPQLLHP